MHYVDARELASLDEIEGACRALQELQNRYAWPITQDDDRWRKLHAAKRASGGRQRGGPLMTLSPRMESILVTAIVALVIAMIALGAEHHLAVMS